MGRHKRRIPILGEATPWDRIQDLAHQIIWLIDMDAAPDTVRSYAQEIMMQLDIIDAEGRDDAKD